MWWLMLTLILQMIKLLGSLYKDMWCMLVVMMSPGRVNELQLLLSWTLHIIVLLNANGLHSVSQQFCIYTDNKSAEKVLKGDKYLIKPSMKV